MSLVQGVTELTGSQNCVDFAFVGDYGSAYTSRVDALTFGGMTTWHTRGYLQYLIDSSLGVCIGGVGGFLGQLVVPFPNRWVGVHKIHKDLGMVHWTPSPLARSSKRRRSLLPRAEWNPARYIYPAQGCGYYTLNKGSRKLD